MEEDAGDDPENIEAAEEELPEFKSNLNTPRKEADARLLFSEGGRTRTLERKKPS